MSPESRRFAGILLVALPTVMTGFFLSVLSPETREPSAMIHLAYAGGAVLAAGVLALGVGLLRGSRR